MCRTAGVIGRSEERLPAARVIGEWRVPLVRPRDIAEVKLDRAFHELHREIWQTLKSEVLKGYALTEGG